MLCGVCKNQSSTWNVSTSKICPSGGSKEDSAYVILNETSSCRNFWVETSPVFLIFEIFGAKPSLRLQTLHFSLCGHLSAIVATVCTFGHLNYTLLVIVQSWFHRRINDKLEIFNRKLKQFLDSDQRVKKDTNVILKRCHDQPKVIPIQDQCTRRTVSHRRMRFYTLKPTSSIAIQATGGSRLLHWSNNKIPTIILTQLFSRAKRIRILLSPTQSSRVKVQIPP